MRQRADAQPSLWMTSIDISIPLVWIEVVVMLVLVFIIYMASSDMQALLPYTGSYARDRASNYLIIIVLCSIILGGVIAHTVSGLLN